MLDLCRPSGSGVLGDNLHHPGPVGLHPWSSHSHGSPAATPLAGEGRWEVGQPFLLVCNGEIPRGRPIAVGGGVLPAGRAGPSCIHISHPSRLAWGSQHRLLLRNWLLSLGSLRPAGRAHRAAAGMDDGKEKRLFRGPAPSERSRQDPPSTCFHYSPP